MPSSLLAPSPLPWLLCTLLLLATSLSGQCGGAGASRHEVEPRILAPQGLQGGKAATSYNTVWDNPNCTRGVVLVPQGEPAVMTCKISNEILQVVISLCNKTGCREIIQVTAPGIATQHGWRLQVQGSVAELLITQAQATQAGEYRWLLEGLQFNMERTTLNVSEPHDLNHTWNGGGLEPHVGALEASREAWPITVVFTICFLVLAVVCLIAWLRCPRSQPYAQMRHFSTFGY